MENHIILSKLILILIPKNITNLFSIQFFSNEKFYDYLDTDDEDDDSDYYSDIQNYSNVNPNNYNCNPLLSDPDSKTELDEGRIKKINNN